MTSHQAMSERLMMAYRNGPIASLRDELPATDADGAYAVQAASVRSWVAAGRRIIGRKIGLTSAAVQAQLGVAQPDYGVLFQDMQVANGGQLRHAQLLQPKAEAEIAFIMATDVADREISREAMAAAVKAVVPAIEIVDSRIADWKITFADTVADNGSSAYFVLGDSQRALPALDLWTCGMVLEVNGQVRAVGAGAACLGHPLNAAVWLARVLAERGEGLRAGDVLLTGALGPMVAIQPDDEIRASIGGLGSVSFCYAKDGP
jgi:2-keto-4-pentenoate hydratase